MNRKGSTMVEAALVFPVVLLTLIALIKIQLFLYEDAATLADLHQAIRYEAGCDTGTFKGKPGSSNVASKSGFDGIYRVMRVETWMTFEGNFMLHRTIHKKQTGQLFLIDERKYARYVDFFNMKEKTDPDESQNIHK